MSKKLLSLALALVMCLGLTVPAFAAGELASTTIQDDGGFSYTLSKPLVGTRVDDQQGVTYYQIPEGTIITPVVPEGTVKEEVEEEGYYMGGRLVYKLPNGGGVAAYVVGTVFDSIYGGYDAQWFGDLEGMSTFDFLDEAKATPTQPLPATPPFEGDRGYCLSRGFCEDYNTFGGFDRYTYLWFEIVPDNGGTTTTPTQPTVPTVGGFTDVKETDWFADPVLWAVEKNITAGTSDTTFSPNADCTTAQILSFLWRANGSPKPTMVNPFSDVKSGDWYADAAAWAYEKGLVSGTAFGGDTLCTRSMAVTYMWKAAGSPSARAASFTDVSAGAEYADAVAWAVEQGVTAGTSDTTFSPESVCTRGQIVSFLYRGLEK